MRNRPEGSRAATALARLPWIGPRVLLRLHRGFGALTVDSWDRFVAEVERLRPAAVSFDVFDTCLVRRLAGDDAIEAAIALDGGVCTPDRLEIELCRPVPGAVDAIERLRPILPNVVFLSDTDRSSDLLERILTAHGLFRPGDVVVASCEEGATKSSGDLFDHEAYRSALAKVAGTTPFGSGPDVWHVGNSPWADGAMAAASDLTAVVITDAEPNRYEALFVNSGDPVDPADPGPALAAAARSARLQTTAAGPGPIDPGLGPIEGLAVADVDGRELRYLGNDVGGLAMSSFALWVADRCRVNDLDHVVFLSRDGELPLRVARAIPGDHWDHRSLDYLHCSRLTWSLAAASAIGVDRWIDVGTATEQAFLLVRANDLPFSTVLNRIGLVAADLARFGLPYRELLEQPEHEPLPESASGLWADLLADPEVRALVACRSDERRQLILDHLRRVDFPSGAMALVDVGWTGRLAWQMSAVLADHVEGPIVHLHFGGDKASPAVDGQVTIERFVYNGYSPPALTSSPVSCVESLTASARPRVVSYDRGPDGEVDTIFEPGSSALTPARAELWSGILETARAVPSRAELASWGLTAPPAEGPVAAVLAEWWNHPTPSEAAAVRSLTFEQDEAGTSVRPLVVPYRLDELITGDSVERTWRQGSRVLSSRPVRLVLKVVRAIDRFAHLWVGGSVLQR